MVSSTPFANCAVTERMADGWSSISTRNADTCSRRRAAQPQHQIDQMHAHVVERIAAHLRRVIRHALGAKISRPSASSMGDGRQPFTQRARQIIERDAILGQSTQHTALIWRSAPMLPASRMPLDRAPAAHPRTSSATVNTRSLLRAAADQRLRAFDACPSPASPAAHASRNRARPAPARRAGCAAWRSPPHPAGSYPASPASRCIPRVSPVPSASTPGGLDCGARAPTTSARPVLRNSGIWAIAAITPAPMMPTRSLSVVM